MKFSLVFFVVSICSVVVGTNGTVWTTELIEDIFGNATSNDITARVPQMVAGNNYTVEVHNVTTADGYILGMHRIPASPTSPAADDKPVVFLMHGLFCSSADWVVMGPEKSFGYILADAGYDVWMGNARGNLYSATHTPTIDEDEFWDFSWHEIGYYDLPAMIDFILETTGQDELIFIGHSQGVTSFLAMASLRPKYNDKIKVMFGLSPIAYIGNISNPLMKSLSYGTFLAESFTELLGVNYIVPSSSFLRKAKAENCGTDDLSQYLCFNIIFLLGGYDLAQLNVSTLPIIFGHFPTGASTKELLHYSQEIQSEKFRQYDFGLIKNLIKYRSISPPAYDLSSVTAPVYMVYGDNDLLCSPKDVIRLNDELGNPIEMRRVDYDTWSHFDFIWGIDAKELVYTPILETLKSNYSSS